MDPLPCPLPNSWGGGRMLRNAAGYGRAGLRAGPRSPHPLAPSPPVGRGKSLALICGENKEGDHKDRPYPAVQASWIRLNRRVSVCASPSLRSGEGTGVGTAIRRIEGLALGAGASGLSHPSLREALLGMRWSIPSHRLPLTASRDPPPPPVPCAHCPAAESSTAPDPPAP